ncbi:MAG: hypothetical protein EA383_08825 [Spirochaetaceae bacterium]|nr:MAG: hypothetical protein EA383_08825 [Spirochaetaceae bacterium]
MAKIRKTDSFLSRNIAAVHLFAGATLILPAYLFQQNLLVRIAQVLLFAWLATVNGKRIKWNYFVIMVTSITFFHTLNPFGEVLLSIGPYTMTRGALRGGLFRGVTIVGLVFLSLFSIRPDLKLPGKLGGLLGQVFYYFERVFEGKKKIRVKAIIESLDEILWDLFIPGETVEPAYIEGSQTTVRGWLFLFVLVGTNWFFLFYRIPFVLL